ncbi:MAG: hypothetical protein J2P30_24135 [Actinobacteria bacterium]|nr:hypothetical protein [Actinomycetota bacterium]
MTTIVIPAAIAASGVYLRWAIRPVLAAYRVGRQVERMLTALYGSTAGPGRGTRKDASVP